MQTVGTAIVYPEEPQNTNANARKHDLTNVFSAHFPSLYCYVMAIQGLTSCAISSSRLSVDCAILIVI